MRKVLLTITISATPAFAQVPALITDLGSPDFRTREAATDKLRTLGADSLQPLQDSLTKGNPEANRRAELLIAQIRQRLSDEAAIAPKLVAVNLKNVTLQSVFDELRKQTTYEFRIPGYSTLLVKEVSLDTGGKVPLWSAVAKLCEVAGLDVEGTNGTITLKARGLTKANPTAFTSGVRIEAVPLTNLSAFALNQVPVQLKLLPEPGIPWVNVVEVIATKATDDMGHEFKHDYAPGGSAQTIRHDNRRVLTGRSTFERVPVILSHEAFFSLSVPRGGTSTKLSDLEGLIWANVWGAPEEILSVRGFEIDRSAIEDSNGSSMLSAKLVTNPANKNATYLDVVLSYDMNRVKPRTTGAESHDPPIWLGQGPQGQAVLIKPAGAKPTREMVRNDHGLSLTDAAGNPFVLNLNSAETAQYNGNDGQTIRFAGKFRYTFRPVGTEVNGAPAKLAFHGTRIKLISFPFALKDVHVVPGTATGDALEMARPPAMPFKN